MTTPERPAGKRAAGGAKPKTATPRPKKARPSVEPATAPAAARPAKDPATLESVWADRVRANREQAERFRETQGSDFYAPVSALFVAEHDQNRLGGRLLGGGFQPHPERAREPVPMPFVDPASLAAPFDRRLDRGSLRAEDHDDVVDARRGERIERMLEQGPPVERGELLG